MVDVLAGASHGAHAGVVDRLALALAEAEDVPRLRGRRRWSTRLPRALRLFLGHPDQRVDPVHEVALGAPLQ
eukprot:14462377-Alexandrium_andersonii.AAC.1